MSFNFNQTDSVLTFYAEDRIDTVTAPVFEKELEKVLTPDVKKLILDFEKMEYISSAGLRVLLSAQKKMKSQGSLVIRHVSEEVMQVFEMTGFSDILTIE